MCAYMEMTSRPAHGKSHLTQWLIQCTQIDSGWLSSSGVLYVLRVRSDWPARGSKGRGTRRRFLRRRRRARIWSRCLFLLYTLWIPRKPHTICLAIAPNAPGCRWARRALWTKNCYICAAREYWEGERETKMRTLLKRKKCGSQSVTCVCVQQREEKGSSRCVYLARPLKRERMAWNVDLRQMQTASVAQVLCKANSNMHAAKHLFRHATATETIANRAEFVQNNSKKFTKT
jgi:hypothetical protein